MSRKERNRLTVLANVKAEAMTLREAAEVLCLSYRQVKRVWRRYKEQGDAGLVHRLRGQPSLRRTDPELKTRILARVAQRYPDFGPTLAAEYLAKEGLAVVDHETLRRWLLAEGSRTVRRRRQQHRQWRERKPCFGAMIQLDGSDHDWFEGRRERAVLMVMVDDATGRVGAQFFEQETTRASYDLLEGWVKRFGLPQSLYVDRDSIYRCEGVGSIADQLAGKEPQTQFGRAMEELGVELILANSPQAKGRVERMNGTLQDRLVKALRLENIKDLEAANKYLTQRFLPAFNRRFMVEPASSADVHRSVTGCLNEVLSWEEPRVVQRDWTVSCEKRIYQLDRQHEPLSLVGRKIIVRTLRNGTVQLVFRKTKLHWRELPQRPVRMPERLNKPAAKPRSKPAAGHPWRRDGMAAGRPYWKAKKAAGQAARQQLALGTSSRPSLRSGLPEVPRINSA
jgi:transposase